MMHLSDQSRTESSLQEMFGKPLVTVIGTSLLLQPFPLRG